MTRAPDREPARPATPATSWTRALRRYVLGPEGLRRRYISESVRSYTAALVGFTLGMAWPLSARDSWTAIDALLLALGTYQLTYVVLTLVVFTRTTTDDLAYTARVMRPGGWVNRWLLLAEPGAGATLSVGVGAIIAAVVVLPQASRFPSALPPGLLAGLCGLLIVTAWGTMVLTYAVDYLRRDQQQSGLRFPGDEPRGFTDYLYLSVAVATSFATSDVEVTTRDLRRAVSGNVLAAFVFNAVIVAVAVASIATFAA